MSSTCVACGQRMNNQVKEPQPRMVVFSGGTAFNSIVKEISIYLSTYVTHVLPISDNGGSSREIIRFLGGPAIGDIRSRLIRLAGDSNAGHRSMKHVLEYRLTSESRRAARSEVMLVASGQHPIWSVANSDRPEYKTTLLAFLRHFLSECESRSCSLISQSHTVINQDAMNTNNTSFDPNEVEFDFRGGSIGNFVLTGARLFFNSLEAAIFWFSNLAEIPATSRVVPIICVNETVTIAARLEDGQTIVGQDAISHPHVFYRRYRSGSKSLFGSPFRDSTSSLDLDDHGSSNASSHSESAGGTCNGETTKIGMAGVNPETKAAGSVPLPASITRVFYVDRKGLEVPPPAVNVVVVEAIACTNAVVYSMGSLFTSIIPSLIVPGVGEAIASRRCAKILVLNGSHDRETFGMRLEDFLAAILNAFLQGGYDASNSCDRLIDGTNNASIFKCMGSCHGGVTAATSCCSCSRSSYIRDFVTDVIFLDTDEVRSSMVTDDQLNAAAKCAVRTHAVASAEAAGTCRVAGLYSPVRVRSGHFDGLSFNSTTAVSALPHLNGEEEQREQEYHVDVERQRQRQHDGDNIESGQQSESLPPLLISESEPILLSQVYDKKKLVDALRNVISAYEQQ